MTIRRRNIDTGLVAACFLLACFTGCATGSSVVTGEARPPIDPAQVKLYLEPPSDFETIGLVEASSDVEFSSQAATDRAIDELKEQAAKIGANGVLLLGTSSESAGISGYTVGDTFYTTEGEKKVARGRAILVND